MRPRVAHLRPSHHQRTAPPPPAPRHPSQRQHRAGPQRPNGPVLTPATSGHATPSAVLSSSPPAGARSTFRPEIARLSKCSPAGRYRNRPALQTNPVTPIRLSRRLYSPSLPFEVHAADQDIRRSRHDRGRGRPLCVRGHRTWFTDGAGKPADGGGGSGYVGRPRGFVLLTWHFRMHARCRHLPRHRVRTRAGCPGRRGRR